MPYCLLMDGLAKSRRILEAKSIFEEMKKKQVKSGMFSVRCFSVLARFSPELVYVWYWFMMHYNACLAFSTKLVISFIIFI